MRELGILVAGHLIGPAEQLVALLLRHTEQSGDHLEGQLTRHLLDEVAMPLRRSGLDDVLRALGEFITKTFHRTWGEPTRDDAAQAIVVLAVHVEQDDALHVDVFALDVIGELRNGGIRPGVIDVAAARHLLDVFVPGDHPVTAVIEPALADLLLAPPDRRDLAQLGQFVDGQPHDIAVRIEEVETGRQMGARHGWGLLDITCSSSSKTWPYR